MPKIENGAKTASKKNMAEAVERKVLYEDLEIRICRKKGQAYKIEDSGPLTAAEVKTILGWEEEGDKVKFGSSYSLVDAEGRKVRMHNNPRNRPFSPGLAKTYAGEILKGNWQFNGETMVVGRTGISVSAQHRGAGLILAAQEWAKNKDRWPFWTSEPTMPAVVVFGIEETDKVVNTVDTGKGRSLADVVYRSELFALLPERDRRQAARMTDYAIRLLWMRTGAALDAFAPRRTHAESLDFVARHPKLLECVRHILDESRGENSQLALYISPGYAAGLLYLMGSSGTRPKEGEDETEYQGADVPHEEMLNWGNWSKACDFFVKLSGGAKEMEPVKKVMAKMITEGKDSPVDRWSVLIGAWICYADGDPIPEADLEPEYHVAQDGTRTMVDYVTTGGIDLGNPTKAEDEAPQPGKRDPTPAQIAAAGKKIREKKAAKTVLVPRRKGKNWVKGDVAWIRDEDGEHYLARLTESPEDCDDGDPRLIVEAADGNQWEVKLDDLSLAQPTESVRPRVPTPATVKLKPSSKKDKKPATPSALQPGELRWVEESDGEHWRGRVVEVLGKNVRLKVDQGFKGAAGTRAAAVSQLRATQPKTPGMKE